MQEEQIREALNAYWYASAITEYTITDQRRPAYTVSIMEFSNGKVVHETQDFADPFVAPSLPKLRSSRAGRCRWWITSRR